MTPSVISGMPKNAARTLRGVSGSQPARDAGLQQRAVVVVVVDARHGALGRAHEAEAVAALHVAERRDVEDLARAQLAPEAELRAGKQVAVALAEGVVDLDDDGRQRAVGAVAVPEADRLEDVAEHARVGVQPDLAVGIGDAFGAQQFVEPGQRVGAAVAVVAVVEGEQAEAVARQRGARALRAGLRIGSIRK